MAGAKSIRKTKKKPMLQISAKPYLPFYEKLAVNIELAMKPKT